MHARTHQTRARLREAIASPEGARGAFVKIPSLEPIDLLARAAADFCIVDLEHAAIGEQTVLTQIAYARALGLPCMVRLAAAEIGRVGRLLDAGAAGIQLSDVADAAPAEGLVKAAIYPPAGDRGVSPTQRDGDFGVTPVASLLSGTAPVLVAQIERDLGEETIRRVSATGVDVLFLGPVDLAARLGTERTVEDVAADLVRATADGSSAVGEHRAGRALTGEAGRYVTVTSDLSLLAAGIDAAFS